MRTLMTTLLSACVAVSIGCGGGGVGKVTPAESCEYNAELFCEKTYACLTEQERAEAQLPATEAECVTQLKGFAMCDAATTENYCVDGATYDAEQAGKCIDALSDQSCTEFKNDNAPEACTLTCV